MLVREAVRLFSTDEGDDDDMAPMDDELRLLKVKGHVCIKQISHRLIILYRYY